MVKLTPQSLHLYMDEEWLIRGLDGGSLSLSAYGDIIPLGHARVQDVVVGKIGRKSITEQKEVLDFTLFYTFYSRYESFIKAREIEDDRINSLAIQQKVGDLATSKAVV